MYLVVGLGNPEEDYDKTRHNMGFHVINELAKAHEIEMSRSKFNGTFGTGTIAGEKVMLLKPQTFMNSSGECVVKYEKFYKLEPSQLLIVYDDIDLEPGKIRIRKSGSPSSHNGMKSVVHFLNSEEIPRVRVGIGRPNGDNDLISHVIGEVPEEEWNLLNEGVNRAKEAVEKILEVGIEKTMNLYN